MKWMLVAVLVLIVVAAFGYLVVKGRRRSAAALADAAAEARRWHERLGGQLGNLPTADDRPAVRQALADASERYNAAGSQLASAGTARQYQLARETALEGLWFVRAARAALGFDPGPDLPPLAATAAAGEITKERSVEVQGQQYVAGPQPGPQTPYYHPGGLVAGRPVPRGWYSDPWWRTALVAGAWGVGGALIFSALFSPVWGDPGYDPGLADAGASELDAGDGDAGMDDAGPGDAGMGDAGMGDAGMGDAGMGDAGMGDAGMGDAGNEVSGDELGGDFGGGDFGGGDFGGGDFGGGDF